MTTTSAPVGEPAPSEDVTEIQPAESDNPAPRRPLGGMFSRGGRLTHR